VKGVEEKGLAVALARTFLKDEMMVVSSRWMRSILSIAVLATLAACGGGGDGSSGSSGGDATPASVAHDDTVTVPWNASTAIDVTANDTISGGTPTVTVATAPAHGSATVDGTRIVYTPTAGYFGDDTLSYTVGTAGHASAANVQVAVAATMTLKGNVHDAPMPGAKVVLAVGGVDQPAVTADAQGNYQATLTTNRPADLITVKATGSGPQSKVVLISLVGDAGATAAVASTTGIVDAKALPATDVTHISTATTVLLGQALGKAPASRADIDTGMGQFTADQTIQMATAIKLVADEGVDLPNGVSDTLSLVSNAAAFKDFISTQIASNAAVYNATRTAILNDSSMAVALPVPANGASDVTLFWSYLPQGIETPTQLVLRADGTAVVPNNLGGTNAAATWKTDGTQVTVTYTNPDLTSNFQTYLDPTDNQQHNVSYATSILKIHQVGGTPGAGPAILTNINTLIFQDGPDAGKQITATDWWESVNLLGEGRTFSASDFTVGSEWAGVVVPDTTSEAPNYVDGVSQDTLKIVDATNAIFERTKIAGTYALDHGRLIVTIASGVYRYTRQLNGTFGEERWLVERIDGGASSGWYDVAVVKVAPGMKFTSTNLTHKWLSNLNDQEEDIVDFSANGTGYLGNSLDASNAGAELGTWNIASDGGATLTAPIVGFSADGSHHAEKLRTLWLVAASGNKIYVMDRSGYSVDGDFDGGRYMLNVFTNVGN
jgi:hypothetical protein